MASERSPYFWMLILATVLVVSLSFLMFAMVDIDGTVQSVLVLKRSTESMYPGSVLSHVVEPPLGAPLAAGAKRERGLVLSAVASPGVVSSEELRQVEASAMRRRIESQLAYDPKLSQKIDFIVIELWDKAVPTAPPSGEAAGATLPLFRERAAYTPRRESHDQNPRPLRALAPGDPATPQKPRR